MLAIYNQDELETLFNVVRGDPIELAVILAAFYGLRRSEVVGLKWDAIDFEKKTFTIKHTVTQVTVDVSNRNSWSIRRYAETLIARSIWIISMSTR